jgi:hypothetical protein
MDESQSPEWQMFQRKLQDQEVNFENMNSRYDASFDFVPHGPSLIG